MITTVLCWLLRRFTAPEIEFKISFPSNLPIVNSFTFPVCEIDEVSITHRFQPVLVSLNQVRLSKDTDSKKKSGLKIEEKNCKIVPLVFFFVECITCDGWN